VTRHPTDPAPTVDIDLGRGSLVSRTRRVQLFTPPRALTLGVVYDEVLRSGDEFRGAPTIDTASDLGAYDNRSLLVRIGLQHGDDRLQVEHLELEDHSHGSFASQQDLYATRSGRNALRWTRPLGIAWMQLDFGHQAWDHDRRQSGVVSTVSEARTDAALDLALPGPEPDQHAAAAPSDDHRRSSRLVRAGAGARRAHPPGCRARKSRTRCGLESGLRAGVHRLEGAQRSSGAAKRVARCRGALANSSARRPRCRVRRLG
jgi:hypothetical protein